MTLWAFIIPGLLLVVTATAAHFCRSAYWPAVRLSLAVSATWSLPYFVGLRTIFFNTTAFEWTELLHFPLIAIVGGLIGAIFSMLIGRTFVADRQIAARNTLNEGTP